MRVKEFSPGVEGAVTENRRLRLALIFLAAPAFWFALGYLAGGQAALCWLVIAASYSVTLLIGAAPRAPADMGSRRRVEVTRALVAWLGPLFWGGVILVPYLLMCALLYMLLFARENLFPR